MENERVKSILCGACSTHDRPTTLIKEVDGDFIFKVNNKQLTIRPSDQDKGYIEIICPKCGKATLIMFNGLE